MEIKQLYQANYPIVKSFVLQNKGKEHDAQDVFQEAVSVAWYNYRTNRFDDSKGSFDAYIIAIAKNKWIDELRKRNKTNLQFTDEFIDKEEDLSFNIEETERKTEKLLFTFQQIGDKCKEILHSYYYLKHRLVNIAQKFNTTEDVIKTQKSRCMKKLKELMHAD